MGYGTRRRRVRTGRLSVILAVSAGIVAVLLFSPRPSRRPATILSRGSPAASATVQSPANAGTHSQESHARSDPDDPAATIPPDTAVGPDFDLDAPTGGPYPSLRDDDDLWVDVSLSMQRVYVMDGHTVIYTMITSSGLPGPDTYTPIGTYHIQNRGLWFYNRKDREGGEYWVSWKGWGDYLFHSVPMNADKEVIPSVAAELGVPASHGCFHLTISDARWFYENIPAGTKVVVEEGADPYAETLPS